MSYGKVRVVSADRGVSPLFSLFLLRDSVVSLVEIDGVLFFEYYKYLFDVFGGC